MAAMPSLETQLRSLAKTLDKYADELYDRVNTEDVDPADAGYARDAANALNSAASALESMTGDLTPEINTFTGLTFGNPGESPLYATLGEGGDWLRYEAAVVEAAANEPGVPADVEAAAIEQAADMREAADVIDAAAETAAETAAEVYNETGIPSDEQPAPVVSGNPDRAPRPIQHGGEWITPWASRGDDGEFTEWNDDEVVELVAGLDAGTYQTAPITERILRQRLSAIRSGNYGAAPLSVAPERSAEIRAETAELLPPTPVSDPGATSTAAADVAPEPVHWYRRPLIRAKS